ncbi:hypothetical protein [Ulvibacter antarcticus]|uniref:Mechanosensitive ion channel-like protein n=1 Tax=Ulvibacter antarcticus TaxID=442714 RepID=A0A3L9YDR5_9FLAO|nr:hypothetical protein [Ulvibacter antarcticus]RMA58594.1 hypothetical protein BXY75_1967 [Ulvibacter antarcticus]
METDFTWKYFGEVLIGLFALYWIFKFLTEVFVKLSRKSSTKKLIRKISTHFLTLYIPLAVLLLIISFIRIDYIVHGIIFLAAGIIGFPYIRNYLNGILIKLNPLIETGTQISTGDFKGEITELLALGAILKVPKGKHFVNYSEIQQHGFSILYKEDDAILKSIYISEAVSEKEILDLMFDNPMVNFSKPPTLKKVAGENLQRLQFTLENGAKTKDLIAYFERNNIETISKQKAL